MPAEHSSLSLLSAESVERLLDKYIIVCAEERVRMLSLQ